MVVEYIRYAVPEDRRSQFEEAWSQAESILTDAPECVRYEVAHGVEEPQHYIVRIEWTSLDDHEQGFRTSAAFSAFFELVKPFFDDIQEMRHYDLTEIGGPR